MFEQFLEEIGLSEKEAKLYLALLQVDSGSIANLAERTKINRTTVYPVLESLGKKGLVSEVQEGKKVVYQAAPPERLETYVERQKVVLQEQSERLKDVIPQIKSIQREQGERPVVEYFEGKEGALSAYHEFYAFDPNTQEDGYFIFNKDLLATVFTQQELDRFLNASSGKILKPNSVYNYAAGEFLFKRAGGNRKRIDENKYPIKCDISIARDRVVITTLGEKVSGFFIISKDFAETLKSLVKKINDM